MFSGTKSGNHWEKSVMCLLLATLLISGVVESLVVPMSATNGDDNAISSSGAAEQLGFPYAYAVPPQCMTTPLREMAPRLRRLCVAIATISNIPGGMDRFYVDDKAMRDNGALLDSGVKRQDIDHVFLRFGRSR
ncbi:hypothetical protein J437_LFUL002529 [Ladona fulva]|uniref:Uncharacterized protein n=1 Tax=Ladona fulva TaxID=123851 RepID=A0A8K0KT47_LADFU|nr:hypothetical protein J437_LFUL002529 [Ladona fulva]